MSAAGPLPVETALAMLTRAAEDGGGAEALEAAREVADGLSVAEARGVVCALAVFGGQLLEQLGRAGGDPEEFLRRTALRVARAVALPGVEPSLVAERRVRAARAAAPSGPMSGADAHVTALRVLVLVAQGADYAGSYEAALSLLDDLDEQAVRDVAEALAVAPRWALHDPMAGSPAALERLLLRTTWAWSDDDAVDGDQAGS